MAREAESPVVWINGAFGVGKTSVAEELVHLLPNALLFDPELLGSMLRGVIPAAEQSDDFQDLTAWRDLTRDAVASIARARSGAVVVPMTLVDDRYFEQVVGGIGELGVRVMHFSLVAPAEIVAQRLRARGSDEVWGLARVARCVEALRAERFAVHLDASTAGPSDLAVRIASLVGEPVVPARAGA